jgi:CheY-like chemotaxis protein
MATIDLQALLAMAIKTERCVLGISQEELAERAGLHRTYVSDVERGARNPSILSIEKLAQALKLSVSALFHRASNGRRSTEFVEILLVEDDPHDAELTKLAFERARITNPLHVVGDGVEALDFLFGTGAYQHRGYAELPQIILLDLNLPKKSGLEVLRRIKADKLTQDIDVIVLTGSTRDRDMAECRRLGVETYIIKPVGFQNFSELTPNLNLSWTLVKPPRTEIAKSARTAGRKTWRAKSRGIRREHDARFSPNA